MTNKATSNKSINGGAKMESTIYTGLVEDRIAELMSKRNDIMNNKFGWKDSTCKTQLFQVQYTIKTLRMIKELMDVKGDASKLSEDAMKHFNALVEPNVTRTKVTVVVGDSMIDLIMNKYKDVKDVAAKVMKAAGDAGLHLDNATGKFVK